MGFLSRARLPPPCRSEMRRFARKEGAAPDFAEWPTMGSCASETVRTPVAECYCNGTSREDDAVLQAVRIGKLARCRNLDEKEWPCAAHLLGRIQEHNAGSGRPANNESRRARSRGGPYCGFGCG